MLDLNTINILKKQGHIIRSDNTLHGFTKARIVQLVRCLENNWAAALERCENQYKIICGYHEKQEKYRWHDLRKNPEDLPPNGYYDTCSYWHEAYQNNRAFYDADKNRWLFHPDNNTGNPWIEGLSIIAWREIENFDLRKE